MKIEGVVEVLHHLFPHRFRDEEVSVQVGNAWNEMFGRFPKRTAATLEKSQVVFFHEMEGCTMKLFTSSRSHCWEYRINQSQQKSDAWHISCWAILMSKNDWEHHIILFVLAKMIGIFVQIAMDLLVFHSSFCCFHCNLSSSCLLGKCFNKHAHHNSLTPHVLPRKLTARL